MSYAYNRSYLPPIPTLDIVLRHPDGGHLGPLPALIDTGADAIVIPSSTLDSLGVEPYAEGFMRSQWGERRPVDIYLVDIQIGDGVLLGIDVVGDDVGSEIILGRNALNKLIVLLDGPSGQTDILDRRPHTG